MTDHERNVEQLISWLETLDADALRDRLQYNWSGVRVLVNRIHEHLAAKAREAAQ